MRYISCGMAGRCLRSPISRTAAVSCGVSCGRWDTITLQRWLFDEDGGLAGIQQWPHLNPDPVPVERMVIYRFRRARANPEGERSCAGMAGVVLCENIQHIEAIGIERNLAGLPVITLPENADRTESDDDTTDGPRGAHRAQRAQ